MGVRYSTKKYSKEKEGEIRCSIFSALQDLATFNGIDINTMKETPPYSLDLQGVTTQKIAAELKKMIEHGIVVKGVVRGRTVKYMLRQTYEDLVSKGELSPKDFGYGDYRDNRPKVEYEDDDDDYDDYDEDNDVCIRIMSSSDRTMYTEMW